MEVARPSSETFVLVFGIAGQGAGANSGEREEMALTRYCNRSSRHSADDAVGVRSRDSARGLSWWTGRVVESALASIQNLTQPQIDRDSEKPDSTQQGRCPAGDGEAPIFTVQIADGSF